MGDSALGWMAVQDGIGGAAAGQRFGVRSNETDRRIRGATGMR